MIVHGFGGNYTLEIAADNLIAQGGTKQIFI